MWICWIGIALNQILMFGLGIVLPDITAEMNLSASQAGALGAVGGGLTALLSIPMNAWVAKHRPKLTIGLSIAGMALAYLANGLAHNYPLLLIARSVGILISMTMIGAVLLIQTQWFPPDRMGTINGIRLGMVNVGQITATAVLPIMMANLGGWRGAYRVMAAVIVPVAGVWFLLGQERRTPEYEARVAAQAEAGSPIKAALRRKEFLLLGVGVASAVMAHIAFLTFWPTYVIEEKGLEITTAGSIMSILAIGSMVASFTGGVISDRIGLRRPLLLISGLILPVVYFVLLQFNSVAALTVTAFIVGFWAFCFTPVVLAIPFELKGISPQEAAVGVGYILAIINGGMAVGAQLAGILIDSLGAYRALALLCLTPLPLTLFAWMLPETGPKSRNEAAIIPQAE